MKKSMVSLTLLLSLLATTGCSESAKAKTIKDDNGKKVDVMYTYGEGENEVNVTADEVYKDLLDSTAGSKAIFEKAYKKVIQSKMEEDGNKARNNEIKKEAEEDMVTWLQDAKNQASDNGVSKDTMIDALLEEEGVETTEELEEKKVYAKQKEYLEDTYYDNNRTTLVNNYVSEYLPVHVRGILVKLADSNNTYFARSISEEETKKLARTTNALIDGMDFNLIAGDTKYSDHSTSQTDASGDLGIMDATTSFNNEYKLGIYSYFAYGDQKSAKALDLLTGNDEALKTQYNALYGNGFNVIDADQVSNLKNSAELKKNALGNLINSNTVDGDYKTLNLPRNVIYNNFFNDHKVSFLKASDKTKHTVNVKCAEGALGTDTKVVANKYGYPILVLTDENGVQFISIDMDSFETNVEAAKTYFGEKTEEYKPLTLNGKEYNKDDKKELKMYYALGKSSDKNSRVESVDNQVKNYINRGYSSSVSANQDFYYYNIYNEWLENDDENHNRLKSLYGDKVNEVGSWSNTMYTQVTTYINSVEAYRTYLINESKVNTGEAFAKTLRLQTSYEDWVRPLWLAYFEGYKLTADDSTYVAGTELTADQAKELFEKYSKEKFNNTEYTNLDHYNQHLGGGALYEK